MSRFITINQSLINVDHIVSVAACDGDTIKITLANGETIETEATPELDQAIFGMNHPVAIIPCNKLYALMELHKERFTVPVRHLVLNSDGSYYPLAQLFQEDDPRDEAELIAYVENPDIS